MYFRSITVDKQINLPVPIVSIMPCLSMNKIRGVFSTCFVTEQYFWKLVCIFCTGLLFSRLLWDCFWIRPTVSTVEKIKLTLDIFPDILVCKEHGFEIKQLKSYGYKSTANYVEGIGEDNKFRGWSGLKDSDPLRKAAKLCFKNSFKQEPVLYFAFHITLMLTLFPLGIF